VFDAAGVDVDLLTQCRVDHRRAFDVPAGEAFAPRRVPAHFLVLFPQDEIGRVVFFFAYVDAGAGLEALEIDAAEFAVGGEPRGVVIDGACAFVCVAFFDERLHERDLGGDVRARARERYRIDSNIERAKIIEEYLRVFFGELCHVLHRDRHLFPLEALGHFVLAFVRVGTQVPEVGDIDDLFDGEAVIFERPAQHVGEDEHRKIPDVLGAVHGRAAVVHAYRMHSRRQREFPLRFAERIKEVERLFCACGRSTVPPGQSFEQRHIRAIPGACSTST
jgi:hypothetical protein